MNWGALAALAELAGAVAVVVTLVYLAVQLRQNSTLLKASIATASHESTNQQQSTTRCGDGTNSVAAPIRVSHSALGPAQQIFSDGHHLHFIGTGINLQDLRVAH